MKNMFLYLFIVLTILGCSEAPKDYGVAALPEGKVDPSPVAPTLTDVENPAVVNIGGVKKPATDVIKDPMFGEGEGSATADAKAKANSQQPIVYAQGAGGITFKTTLTEAEQILSKPLSGPDIEGNAYYEGEGLYISWRIDEPRTPNWILILSSYLGSMQMPTPLAPVGMNHDFSLQYEKNTEAGAQAMARDYYRIFENKQGNYDCIALQTCFVEWGTEEQKNFVVNIPGRLLWLVSKDRFVLFRMMLFRQNEQKILANNLDILTGEFMIPNEKSIAFGDSYEEVENRLQIDTNTSVSTDTFGREYDGIYLGYQRSDFSRDATTPLPTDKLKLVQVWNNYKNLLTVGGKPVLVRESANDVEISIGQANTNSFASLANPSVREVPLSINLDLQRQNVKVFSEKLRVFLEEQVKAKYPTWLVTSRFSGAYQIKKIKSYLLYVVAFDVKNNEGIYMQVSVGEEQGNINSFFMMKLGGDFNTLDPRIVEQMTTPIEKVAGAPVFNKLSSFKIGDVVEVKDWDLGRAEATAVIADASGAKLETRVSYSDRSVMFVAFNTEKDEPQDQAAISLGSLNVGLGLKLISEAANLRTYKVVSVTSTLNVTEVRGLCGGKFVPKFGMSDTEFLNQLGNLPECPSLLKYATSENGRIGSVYFPQDRIRLSFGDEELTQATVYAPITEVK